MVQVCPQTHEVEAYLNYAPVEDGDEPIDWDGLDPYWALNSLLIHEADGYHEVEAEIDGEPVTITLGYSKSGIAPAPEHDVDGDRLYELELNVKGHGERKCHYNVSPRFPMMRHHETGDSIDTPFDHLDPDAGVSVHAQASNLYIDEIPQLFPRALFEVADDLDTGIYHGYFDQPFSGRVTAIERYVRIIRSMNEKLIGTGGVLDRLSMLLSDANGTKGEYKWDNEDVRGHHHVVRHGTEGAKQLVSRHRFGGQIKSYLPQHPEEFSENDPLYHPKVGTKFVAGRSRTGAVDWEERHEIIDELDERLLSVLSWADVPTEAGGTTYVADDHFAAEPADDSVPLHSDPLPQLEENQEHLLVTCLRDMTDSDEEIVGEIATDGGMHVRDLADQTDLSLSTVYRCLDRMEGVITSDNGHVRFVSERLRREVRSIVESVESMVESAADRVAEIVDFDVRQSASSAFDRWMAKYQAEFEPPKGDGDRPTVRIDTVLSELKSTNAPLVEDAIDEMLTAWRRDGRDVKMLLDAIVQVTIDGQRDRYPVRALR